MRNLFMVFFLLGCSVAQATDFKVEEISQGHEVIWGMSLLDDRHLLFTERSGRLSRLNLESGRVTEIQGLPAIASAGQGGLLDVKTEPGYGVGGWIYLTYSKDGKDGAFTVLARTRLKDDQLVDWQDLLETVSAEKGGRHFGSRIAFDKQGHVFFSVGDRGHRPHGQDLMTHAGTILRLNMDGTVPADNPFVGRSDALDEIWSYGHRNPQGLAYDEQHQGLWIIEHGPRGGDEINWVKKGRNYGWPVISYGKEYWGPKAVGEGTHRRGMEQPVKYYVPSIAPGSLLLYSGAAFPEWRGSLFAGALKLMHLNRVSLNTRGQAIAEERLLKDLRQRLRSLLQGPQGEIFVATDSGNIYRIVPDK